MATNIVLDGSRRTFAAPTGGVSSGDVVKIGGYIGVALTSASEGKDFVLEKGRPSVVAVVPKASGETWSVGDAIYWDASAGNATTNATGTTYLGLAHKAAALADTSGEVDVGA